MTSADPDFVVSVARGWLGTPYHDQASLRGVGCDCLGLARGVWREVVGAESFLIPPYSRDWGETGPHEVLAHDLAGGIVTLTLLEAPVRAIADGDSFIARAGCDKRIATCGAKFTNVANFRGFPNISGQDSVLRYASRDGSNTGGVL